MVLSAPGLVQQLDQAGAPKMLAPGFLTGLSQSCLLGAVGSCLLGCHASVLCYPDLGRCLLGAVPWVCPLLP